MHIFLIRSLRCKWNAEAIWTPAHELVDVVFFFEVPHYEIVLRFWRPTQFLLFSGILKHSQNFRCIRISHTCVFPWHSLLIGNKYRPLIPTGHESTALYLFCIAHQVLKSISQLRLLIQFPRKYFNTGMQENYVYPEYLLHHYLYFSCMW